MSGPQKLLSLELPKVVVKQICASIVWFLGVWADCGHGYAAAPTSLRSRTRL